MTDTKIKIVEAAEIEFAERGFEGASIRSITARAGANVAAINYHFGSKTELFKAMIRYRIEPINVLRLSLLDEAFARSGGQPLAPEEVVEIIVRPLLQQLVGEDDRDHHFMKAMARGMCEEQGFMRDLEEDVLKQVLPRFHQALMLSLGLKDPAFGAYCLHLLSCTLIGAMHRHGRPHPTSDSSPPDTVEERARRLVLYIAGGMKAVAASCAAPPSP